MAISPFPITLLLTISLLLLPLSLSLSVPASPPPSPPPLPSPPPPSSSATRSGSCADSLLAFSPCLPYVSAAPNNASSFPDSNCCRFVSNAMDSGDVVCLCYVVRDPSMLGFPVDVRKVMTLSSLCSRRRRHRSWNGTVASICSGLKTLTPLQSPGDGFLNHTNAVNQTSSHPVTAPVYKASHGAPAPVYPPLSSSDETPDLSSATRIRGISSWCSLLKGIFIFVFASAPASLSL